MQWKARGQRCPEERNAAIRRAVTIGGPSGPNVSTSGQGIRSCCDWSLCDPG
ncbi:hypothetical protein CSPX01_13735 [Colletotrichum filicis]|nr:hypothetical protein CSPX01_13735 [Colletotrichum filicis]